MAEESKNITVISKKNSGFPDYLDFNKLRAEGIDYLGRLAGKIWTDHNVHDPGITILESLCYALIDLGYRTNLPEADIFTRNPEDKTPDNNFFTPAQILACNPLTITDFRKLLIDIEGVKNAWLEIATDQKDICRPVIQPDPNSPDFNRRQHPDCTDYLNGLYHVYIDLDEDVEKKYPVAADKEKYLNDFKEKIKKVLMAHRNLCEDFIDVYFLCKQETGVCADIELEDNADVEKVYLSIVESLRSFFSPSPKFYTLQELLDKQKTIDEIFAGRPYNITESHGFVDTEEFELLKLRKEIHLSDVYSNIFEVEGISAVRRLSLRTCKNNTNPSPAAGWKYRLKENHVPEFSIACSGFQFTKNGMPVFIDFKKFEGLFAINFIHNGKIKYQVPSPYLNVEIPKGVYREDLGDYYSIQNEFPQVYGIAEGGLPDSASPLRKAQAYQLKAYLLFFDQLLANYLAQLQHLRSLFALSAPADQNENHSYFSNQLTSVPDLQKLLRFNISDNNNNSLGSEGSLLVLPVNKKKLLELKEQDKLKFLELENIETYSFATLAEQDIAINQLKDDLYFEQFQCEFVIKTDDCVFYYILTSSDDIALISRKYFKNIAEAIENSSSVKYIGTFDENYRSFITTGNVFSFDIELNLLSFSKYLQLIVEDKELFYKRRQGFLNHLLSRFAEQFTEYALLSFGFNSNQQSEAAVIKNKEKFLTNYDDLSSNRGKAYDYYANNWNNDNVSGFEKKFKAISGIENWKRHSLCNFVVAEYDIQFAVTLKIAGTNYFSAEENFDSKDEALTAAHSIFNALREKTNYTAELVSYENAFRLKINYAKDRWAVYPTLFATKEETATVTNNLTGLFIEKPAAESVFESRYIYIPQLKDQAGKIVRQSVKSYPAEEKAIPAALDAITKIDDRKKWEYPETEPALGAFFQDKKNKDVLSFINIDAFKFDINNTIVGKPDKFTYELLDKGNNFKFRSVKEFNNAAEATNNANELLILLTNESNYKVSKDETSGKFLVNILDKEDLQAVCSTENSSLQEAEKLEKNILGIAKSHQYFIAISKVPDGWKFNYQLGYDKNNLHTFQSTKEYESPAEATAAADSFNKAVLKLELKETDNELTLVPPKTNSSVSPAIWVAAAGGSYNPQVKEAVAKLLDEQKEIRRLSLEQNPEAFNASVAVDDISQQGLFVYRLVDKDRIPAFYSKTFTDKAAATGEMKTVVNLFRSQISYLQLCMGGDIIVERKHPATNAVWYRYQLKCLNRFYKSGSLAGKPLILFESTKRYATREDAEKAFAANYLLIIHFASTISGYDKKISVDEIPIDAEDRLIKTDSIVFIPKPTLEDLGTSTALAIQEMINLVLTYPIRITNLNSIEFYQLFPCEKVADENPDIADCKKEKEKKYVYYFTLYPGSPGTEKWQSLKFYETPEAARMDFDFFLLLLYYPGNYYVDCDRCENQVTRYRIYIREVLAESTERFINEQGAWGVNGVQKFICVAQSEDSFHTYLRKENCCHSFYVSCSNGIIYHPCKYDRPQKRDDVLVKLYQLLNSFQKRKSWQTEDNDNATVLLNENGEPFATIAARSQANLCSSDMVATLTDNVLDNDNYTEEDGRLFLKNKNNQTLATSTQEGAKLEEWKMMLQAFVCYYPIIKSKDEKTGDDTYCIEIKLPGFNTCKEDVTEDKPCGCGDKMEADPYDCYIAWKSSCCYATCMEAERALETIMKLLLNYEYYQPVFDCVCASYGITIQFTKNTIIQDQNITYYFEDANILNWQNSEIIAINPQCYPGPEVACKAVYRAKKLINSEGLHLVEHILLRPHCFPDDCQCREYSKICDDETGCEFTWTVQDKDPCANEKDICFVPGTDRYSFIATVALPAWPARFRKPENRRLLENILYHEAPAHVLLRILWLAPHDFCCFETKFKNWNRWLAQKKTCLDNFSVCDFMNFLFERTYECLSECSTCVPCNNDNQLPSCFGNTSNAEEENSFLSQVNDLYCWMEQRCDRYQFIDCDTQVQIPDDNDPADPNTPILLMKEAPSQRAESTRPAKKVSIAEKEEKIADVSSTTKEIKVSVTEPPTASLSKSKPRLVNSRMNKYKTSAATILEASKNNPIATKVQSFLSDPLPSQERLSKLVTETLQNKDPKTKGSKALTKKQVSELLQNCICYYLDKICFNGKNMEKLNELKKVFEKLRKVKIDTSEMLDYWNLPEIKEYEPELNEDELKDLFLSPKK